MKFKIAGLASTALLLLSPISEALTTIAEPSVVQAENNWDYDTADPGLGEYDRLLQNAGPSDGQIDWYPAEHFASSKNIRPSLLVKQLIDLSIATNDANSKARKVLFNDTTGSSSNPNYQETYNKYNLAFGFIAQLLAFNNEKTGQGAYLKQGFESEDGENPGGFHSEDKIAETNQNPDPAILGIPQSGEGINISDVLGRAFFGNATDAYAQLYVNGYDNTIQNAPNIIRETTTSITIVAQSKLTGRKATAIFKLNNKTFNNLPPEVLLENSIDNSLSFAGAWGHKNIPNDEQQAFGDSTNGTFNQRMNLITGLTSDQKRLLSNGSSSAWVDPNTGSGTIVVPRGTSAAEIAKKIKQLGYKSNYNISNVAPMKSIHGDRYSPERNQLARTKDNSYNVTFGGVLPNPTDPISSFGNATALSNNQFDHSSDQNADNTYFAVADPRLAPKNDSDLGYEENSPDIYDSKSLPTNFSNALLYNPLNTNKQDSYGFNDSKGYSNSTAATIPNQSDNARGDVAKVFPNPSQTPGETDSYPVAQDRIKSDQANDQLGNVVHAFDPKNGSEKAASPFKVRESWDDTHAIFGTAPFSGLTEEEIKNQIANNGSFNNTSGDQIKKSFTFNMPLNNTVMKSYRNPYSTVISTALPFAKDNPFKPDDNYSNDPLITSGDMNNSPDSFSGKYLGDSADSRFIARKVPYTNPWYVNKKDQSYIENYDDSGRKIDVPHNSGRDSAKSLHLNNDTWIPDSDYDNNNPENPGTHNVNKAEYEEELGIDKWISNPRSTDINYLEGNQHDAAVQYSNGSPINWQKGPDSTTYKVDAHNKNQFNGWPTDFVATTVSLWNLTGSPRDIRVSWPSSNVPKVNSTDDNNDCYYTTEQHLQLAKNVGYILINVQNADEQLATSLKDYQIPAELNSAGNQLNGISNRTDILSNDLPQINPIDDDKGYRGGLLGKMSIIGVTNTGIQDKPVTQGPNAGSIFNNSMTSSSNYLQSPTKGVPVSNERAYVVKVHMSGSSPVGAMYTNTNLQYGLAWNDSSDLPQVKIERSLNVQYLVPVSVARTVSTTWTQYNNRPTGIFHEVARSIYKFDNWKTGFEPQYRREVKITYKDYQLFLGNVTLGNTNDPATGVKHAIDTNSNSAPNSYNRVVTEPLTNLLPVNNQINYSRLLEGHPHYDSELFDHGSNRDDVTVTRGGTLNDRGFVGTSEEKADDSTNEAKVGSSDDYSIGIVKAPSQFFEGADGNGVFKAKDGVERSTENAAENRPGINLTADSPENNNGMSIGKTSSYATLAQAYNVDINGNKAVGKADDNAKNKEDRVALVQQLLDNGGDARAYYYIPSLPRLYEHWNEARINVVVYDKTAISTPAKVETKPSFSTTDVSTGNDPFNVNLRPYTTTYDDGAVLKGADVPQSFKNLLSNTLVAGNADLVDHPNRLEQVLVSAFLNSWQQNDGSFEQTDTAVGVNSPLYLYGGFGISNSDTKNSYSQWPNGYTTNTGDYLTATSHYSGDFYRGGKDLQLVRGGTVKGIPASALKADVSKVDLSKAGTYPVVYTYTNPNNTKDSASITVPVTVKDAAAPVFAFQGGNDVTLHVGEPFDRTAYKVVGNWQIFNKSEGDYNKLVSGEGIATGSDGKPQVTITGEVDLNTPGVYQVTYEATNLSGIKAKMVRNINVLPQETGNNPDKSDWTVSVMKSVGYINYTPGYGVNVWNAPAGTFTGQRLLHGSSWKIFQKAVNRQGKVYYNVGKNQWLDGAYVSFTPVSTMQPLNGIVTINYVRGYGVNLWKAPKTTGGYHEGRKLKHGTQWKVFGLQDGFYKVGGNQWIQAKYAKFQAR